MAKNGICVICNKRGKNETIGNDYFILCVEHNLMVELDTINNLIETAELQMIRLEKFIGACKNFREMV